MCPFCKLQYCRPDILQRHLDRVSTKTSTVIPIKCHVCGGQFPVSKVLKKPVTKLQSANATIDAINTAILQSRKAPSPKPTQSSTPKSQPALSTTLDVIQKALNSAFGLTAEISDQNATGISNGLIEIKKFECVQCGNDYESTEQRVTCGKCLES